MPIIGFNFTKLMISKEKEPSGQLTVKNRFQIKNVQASKINLGNAKQDVLKFDFSFNAKYEPEVGELEFEGEVIFLAEPKQTKAAVDEWKKNKKMLPEIGRDVINTALNKCNIEALILTRDVNMPPPVPLPNVNQQEQQKKDYIG